MDTSSPSRRTAPADDEDHREEIDRAFEDETRLVEEFRREHPELVRDARIAEGLNDADFRVLAARCSAHGETFAPIYFWPQQSRPVGEMVRRVLREAALEDYGSACSRVHFL